MHVVKVVALRMFLSKPSDFIDDFQIAGHSICSQIVSSLCTYENRLSLRTSASCRSSTAKTTMTSFSQSKPPGSLAAEMASEKIRDGFRKDKGGEKLAESEESLLEHRTDGTDAFDTLYIGCEKFPQHSTTAFNIGGVL